MEDEKRECDVYIARYPKNKDALEKGYEEFCLYIEQIPIEERGRTVVVGSHKDRVEELRKYLKDHSITYINMSKPHEIDLEWNDIVFTLTLNHSLIDRLYNLGMARMIFCASSKLYPDGIDDWRYNHHANNLYS